ncbi:MAG: hypothetical protein WDM80_04455 [Limisphaerales bacterium]
MQNLVKAIATDEPPPSSYTIGETLHAEIWRSEMRNDLISPAGARVTIQRELTGERCSLAFTPNQLGFYTLGSPQVLYAFGVNPATDQSDLRPMDMSLLPREFADNHESHFVSGHEDYDELAKGRPVFHWFVLGALACLLLESGFQFLIRRQAT